MPLSVDIEKNLGGFHLKTAFEAGNEVLALLGASGCGKSLTLKCIAGIEKPDKGRIILNDKTLFDSEKGIDLPPQKRMAGYLFQQYALFPNMTVEQNIREGIRGRRDKKKADAAVAEILERLHMTELRKRKPSQLSGGQQQRTAFARILVNKPEILLLDEPFSALDSHLRFQMAAELQDAISKLGKTVLLVSHSRDEVFRLSDRIAVMNSGCIETIGTKHEVFADPVTRNGSILTGCKNNAPMEYIDGTHIHVPLWGANLEIPKRREGCTWVGIRMHDIRPGEGTNSLLCDVIHVIENPFSCTVMLRPVSKRGKEISENGLIGWETLKDIYETLNGESQIRIVLPPDRLLLLKED